MIGLGDRTFGNCSGVSRRQFLKVGTLGIGGLALPDLLRAKAAFAAGSAARPKTEDISVILIWLDGGPPQHETYDPKPDAPIEFRGPLKAMPTKVPGIHLSELLPLHAAQMDKIALIRSMAHSNGDHFAAAHWMLTGYLGSNSANLAAQYPSIGSVISKVKGTRRPGMPAYVGLPNTHSVGLAPGYHGGAYLGVGYNPFNADGDPNNPDYRVPNLDLLSGVDSPRLDDRRGLLNSFDTMRRDADGSGLMEGLDGFQREAFDMVTGPAARAAFDLSKEDPRLRDRYGRHLWGQSALLGRRLVEAGVRFVTLTYGGWDWHANLDKGMHDVLPVLDHAVGTLISDLDRRGMLDTTMVLVMGEFGRTPRINKGLPQDPTPGRDHWGDVMSVLVAGGGVPGGQTIGASNARGEVPKDRPLRPQDLSASIYRKLGIDTELAFPNRAGRPITLGSDGLFIPEMG
ncbi:DUF1501 domain-containing protein [Isosphaeraceae bacterium EP7]